MFTRCSQGICEKGELLYCHYSRGDKMHYSRCWNVSFLTPAHDDLSLTWGLLHMYQTDVRLTHSDVEILLLFFSYLQKLTQDPCRKMIGCYWELLLKTPLFWKWRSNWTDQCLLIYWELNHNYFVPTELDIAEMLMVEAAYRWDLLWFH